MKRYIRATEEMTFEEWCDYTRYPGFYEATSGLSDEEFFELEDEYAEWCKENGFPCRR